MKVLVINGSPRAKGCTARALEEVVKVLNAEGIETELMQLGAQDIRGCLACGGCRGTHRCVIDDAVNKAADKLRECEGLLVGSPVYYASPNGTLLSFLDRLFHSAASEMYMKVGAAVVSCRRGGAASSFEVLNKYFTICGMPVASSQYWNSVHGAAPGEAAGDSEGLQTMRVLARNMAFLMKSIALGKEKYGLPEKEPWEKTNFIR